MKKSVACKKMNMRYAFYTAHRLQSTTQNVFLIHHTITRPILEGYVKYIILNRKIIMLIKLNGIYAINFKLQ